MSPSFAAAAAAEAEAGRPEQLGLALSGGGLRAAFFHAGVLARLADLGLLGKVDMISTVSGGSIVGALYTLHLAQAVGGGEEVDYHAVVRKTIRDLELVAEVDLRASTFRNPLKTLWMGNPFQDSYSRSDRIAELYDRYLYRQFVAQPSVEGGLARLRYRLRLALEDWIGPWRYRRRAVLRDLHVPGGQMSWLIINATDLNTGHPWRFEADKFGEPKRDLVFRFVDGNSRLPRPDMNDPNLPAKYHEFDVASAVAASACFPGFAPMAMTGLYKGWRPELADGGVYDNQGLEALVHRGCTRFVVSDGSGQMEDAQKADTRVISVVNRAFSIASGSIREDHLRQLLETQPASAVPHLRIGVQAGPVEWASDPPPAGDAEAGSELFPPLPAEWGVNLDVQAHLARVRTDLDAFSEVERQSLMLDGYRLARAQVERPDGIAEVYGATAPANAEDGWAEEFAGLAPHLSQGTPELQRQLAVAKQRFFKCARLLGPVLGPGYTALSAVPVAAVYVLVALAAGWDWPWGAVLDAHPPLWAWLLGLVAVVVVYKVPRLLNAVAWGIVPALGWPVVAWHRWVTNRIFLRLGRRSRL